MDKALSEKLKTLASKYEVSSFCNEDPSQFLRWYDEKTDVECCSFIAAMLSFGSRTQFIPKIRQIMQTADKSSGCISKWLLEGRFHSDFTSPDGNPDKKFYRFYSYADMCTFFEDFSEVLKAYGSLGNAMQKKKEMGTGDISSFFPHSAIVPHGRTSANKRLHMFLRWMVRPNSPVDLGIWTFLSPAELVIPLDVHVLQESQKLGLLPPNAKPSFKTAVALTDELKKIWPDDPCKGDFALFGLGVDGD